MGEPLKVPPLDWNRVRTHVKDFNSSEAPYYLAEVALHEAFRRGLTIDTLPLCILAVDSFWSANLAMEPKAPHRICQSVSRNIDQVSKAIAEIHQHTLPLGEREILYVIQLSCELLPPFLKPADGTRINYSFATKFLHWCCPATLPPVDSFARKTMNQIAGRGTIWVPDTNYVTTEEKCVESYQRLLIFYNDAISQLSKEELTQLKEYDFQTQPEGFRRRNTPVRILDKYLWIEGREPQDRPTVAH